MKHDPFYNQIVNKLSGSLDEDIFEACAIDLINLDGLPAVPIKGGADGGMDGAIADGDGEPFPVVSTTSDRCLANLTKNLNQYIHEGGKRRKVVLATSQPLSPKRQRNLYNRASELGFTLIQLYEQSAIAMCLYRSPVWCQELLQLSGEPSALSIVPISHRPITNYDLVGREDDYQWLTETNGDKLIAGEPGSGKTALLYKFAQENEGLFVIDSNTRNIANAIREQQPKNIIVDDAHVNPDFLQHLKHLRTEIKADFTLIATCWTGDRELIAEILNLPSSNVCTLKRLTQDQMVSVLKSAGIQGVHWLVREIITQSEGLPGLAVTLTHLCLQGDVKQIQTADALTRTIMQFYTKRVEKSVKDILAAFSIGGVAGMSKGVIGQTLKISPIELRKILAELATGGVITQVDFEGDTLMVRPAALRHALIRDVFFSGASALPYEVLEVLIGNTLNIIETVRELIHVKARQGNVPEQVLQRFLLNLPTAWSLWEAYAWLGSYEANWVLDNFTHGTANLAYAVLENCPHQAIPRLLSEAIDDNRLLNATPEHPLRRLEDWIHEPYPNTGVAVKRRKVLFESTKKWLLAENDISTGYKALVFSVSPRFETFVSDAGSGNTGVLRRAYLTLEELEELQAIWQKIILLSEKIPVNDWQPFLDLLHDWAYPHIPVSEELRPILLASAKTMARDILKMSNNKPSIVYNLNKLFESLVDGLDLLLDRKYLILFPPKEDYENWQRQEEDWLSDVKELADEWKSRKPREVVEILCVIESEMAQAQHVYPRLTPKFCHFLAQISSNPLEYAKLIIDANLPSDILSPFLSKSVRQEGWENIVQYCMSDTQFSYMAVKIIMTMPESPEYLLMRALSLLGEFPDSLKLLCMRNEIPETILPRLLTHSNPVVASSAALGEWQRKPKGQVREWLRDEWEIAILECTNDFWLADIFETEPNLAFSWLQRNLIDARFQSFLFDKAVPAAISALSTVERELLLLNLPITFGNHKIAAQLVGDNVDLYSKLLGTVNLKEFHLSPLYGEMDAVWEEKSKLAFAAGYTAEQIASGTAYPVGVTIMWSGKQSRQWKIWLEKFENLQEDADQIFQDIAIAGIKMCQEKYEKKLEEEYNEDVYGR